MVTRDSAYNTIQLLVEKFGEQLPNYKKADYNETLTRKDFIDPFFEALGWDINNKAGLWESYREVIHEHRIKIGGLTKAPDYCFRLGGGNPLFFVEAKKPSVLIKEDFAPAYQVRRYGWNAKLAISIVTDFEEFAVYDCTKKPNVADKPGIGRIKYITYNKYLEEFDFIWDTFSKEKVLKGGLVKFQQAEKKGTATVDKEFLHSLDNWRALLAGTIAKNNPQLSDEEINFAVQQTIDRIIFLRIAEDRSLEPANQLQSTLKHADMYADLFRQFQRADEKYNSGLFDFKKDTISKKLVVDNKVIKSIINDLYYPQCPYEFSVLPVELLGSAYEQFLGKQIVISKGKAVIEEKPEVRKAGGVYYTPQYIVEYIVKNTIGKLVEGKTPKEVGKLKVVDPACGSGSFLLGAYDFLLDWHLRYYKEQGGLKKKDNPLTPDGNLATKEKKRILLNNIYGVDLDANAVEVTKLSLLLKCMEGETRASVESQQKLFHERVLPTLDNNIKSGNSLVGLDYYDSELDFGEEKKIKPFSWEKNFPEVFKQGGFDVVIGNPPYGATISRNILSFLIERFPETKKFPDSYCLFVSQSLKILSKNGLMGFIVPNTFCDLENCDDFRCWLMKNYTLQNIYQTGWAFKDAVVDTLVFLLKKIPATKDNLVSITVNDRIYNRATSEFLKNQLSKIDYRNTSDDRKLLDKTSSLPTLASFIHIKAGVKLYEKGKGQPPQTEKTMVERPYTAVGIRPKGWLPLLRGEHIGNYTIAKTQEFVNYGPWLAAPRSADLFKSPKILMRRTDDKLKSCIETQNAICVNSCHVIKLKQEGEQILDYNLLVALLNSKFLQKIFELQNPQMIGKVFSEIKVIYVERLPIAIQQNENTICDTIKKLSVLMIQLHEELQQTTIPSRREVLEQRIAHTDEKINRLVYELYGLTEEEIKIVEGEN